MTDALLPTHKMRVINPDNAIEEIKEFALGLAESGERPWFEVRYPSPTLLTAEDQARWQEHQEDSFDAVELIDGQIVTLPPYAELLAAGGAE